MTEENLRTAWSTAKAQLAPVDPYVSNLLRNIGKGKTILMLRTNTRVFSQGDEAQAAYFIQSGKIKLSVSSAAGRDAVLAVLGPRDFLGEGCLVDQSFRTSTATTIQPATVFCIERREMLRSLRDQRELSEKFISCLLGRSIDLEGDLCDQLFNRAEKRLARVLLKLSRFGRHETAMDAKMPRVSHETLAEMIGSTRARVTHFMNKFRGMGLIDYDGSKALIVKADLLTDIVLHDRQAFRFDRTVIPRRA